MPSPMLLGTRVQFPPPPFDSLRSLMAGRLSPISVRNHDREGNSESNALSQQSTSSGSTPQLCSLMKGQDKVQRRVIWAEIKAV